mgnify:FL=1
MSPVLVDVNMKKKAIYKFDELFPKGCLVYDKEKDEVFEYKKSKHKKRILENPNNYRRAHKGDFKIN